MKIDTRSKPEDAQCRGAFASPLQLTTDPPGAEGWLYELEQEGFALVERNERQLGVTPLGPAPDSRHATQSAPMAATMSRSSPRVFRRSGYIR